MFERTAQFEDYIAAAARYPAFWRILFGLGTAVGVYMACTAVGFAVLALLTSPTAVDLLIYDIEAGADPFTMFVLLSSFLGMGLGAIAASFWHWRGFLSLIGPIGPALRKFFDTLTITVPVFLISGLILSLLTSFTLTPQLSFGIWAYYLILGIPLLLIQTGSEELIFRGYLTQQLAARFRSFWVWGLIPTLLFGIAHYSSDFDPVTAGLIVLATGTFGFVAVDLTRLTGNLGAAIAFHFTNNFFALFLVAIPEQLSGLALYLTPFTMADSATIQPLILVDILVVLITWQILRRRFA